MVHPRMDTSRTYCSTGGAFLWLQLEFHWQPVFASRPDFRNNGHTARCARPHPTRGRPQYCSPTLVGCEAEYHKNRGPSLLSTRNFRCEHAACLRRRWKGIHATSRTPNSTVHGSVNFRMGCTTWLYQVWRAPLRAVSTLFREQWKHKAAKTDWK